LSDFRGRLRDEIVEAQKTRASLVREKLMFVVGSLGVGAASEKWMDAPALLYLVPLVATIFDLYVAGEDFHVKRLGGFLGVPIHKCSTDESDWEDFVASHPDRFSQFANPATSFLALAGAAAVLTQTGEVFPWFRTWLAGSIFVVVTIWSLSYLANRRVRLEAKQTQ